MTTDLQRIDALESQLAFQDETIQQLSDALVAQQMRIDVLQAKLAQVLAMGGSEDDTRPGDEKPPHY